MGLLSTLLSSRHLQLRYTPLDYRKNDLVKLEFDINKTVAAPLSQIIHRGRALDLGRRIVAILSEQIPSQQVKVNIQARIGTLIVASNTVNAIRKDVLSKCYGGDVTRGKQKQKERVTMMAKGKRRMFGMGRVSVPADAILAVIKAT
ncbi:unnamed protein product [Polarella glacialis]|uniref:GTP-binding protein LepA C-terminal domain-containing protein n=1 Tax=Polarella glacialis TaxID=89957 RepID=A0A813EPH6_POLGL|nr:unnamed protein product [Polarella glacialis]